MSASTLVFAFSHSNSRATGWRWLCVLGLAVVFISGARASQNGATETVSSPAPAVPAVSATGGEVGVRGAELLSAQRGPDYRIAQRDLVQFQIFDEPELLSVQRVSASGQISVPMLGTVKVGGFSLREAEAMLVKAYVDGGYFIKPQVIISVQTYAPRSVSVLGQVNHPEQIEFPVERERVGIVQAITLAGGFTRVAKTDGVRVLRTVEGKEEQYTINVTFYLDSKTGTEFQLLPDDIVYVPERVF